MSGVGTRLGLGSRLFEALADRVGPIVVKELRQGLRTRVFWTFFGLLLAACLTTALVFAALDQGSFSSRGRDAFTAFVIFLAVVEFLVLPYSAYRSMSREREEETWVLLVLTGLGPRRILAGKIRSFVAQGTLYACAAGPFILFSYLLNGVDLVSILVALLGFAVLHVFLVVVSVAVATMGTHRVARGLLHFLLLGALLFVTFTGTAALLEVSRKATRVFDDRESWMAAAAALTALLTSAAVCFELGVSSLALPTENTSRGVRLAWLAQLAALVGGFGALRFFESDPEILVVGSIFASAYVAVAGTFVLSDEDGMAASHRRRPGRRSLLWPGALRAYALQLLGFLGGPGLLCATYCHVEFERGRARVSDIAAMLVMLGLAAFYSGLAQVVARWLPAGMSSLPARVRLSFVALVGLMSGGTPLLALLLTGKADEPHINALHPLIAPVRAARQAGGNVAFPSLAPFALAAGLGVTLLAVAVLARKDRPPSPPVRERQP